MPSRDTFASWLGGLFGQSEFQARRILEDEHALHFLVAWSLFESKCFGGFVKLDQIHNFAQRIARESQFNRTKLLCASAHFHDRYQDKERLRNLLHSKHCDDFTAILAKPHTNLTAEEVVFFTVFVSYRFRNNIFHGNKGVDSWLHYGEQISLCTGVLQALVSHTEALAPTLKIPAVS